jgi:hypothetical protein
VATVAEDIGHQVASKLTIPMYVSSPIAVAVGPIIFFTSWQLMDMRLQDIIRKQPVAFDVVCSEQAMEQCNIYPHQIS